MNISKALDFAIEHYQAGDLERAENICKQILKRKPNNIDALHYIGVIYSGYGQQDLAIKYIKRALEINPNFADAYNNLGNIYQETKQADEAIACYQKALKLNPQSAKTYYNLGVSLQEKGQLDEAVRCYREALQLNFNTFGLFNNLGLALADKGQIDEAINCYQSAISLNPSFAEAYYNLGNAFRDIEQFDQSVASYKKALQVNPNYADAYNNLGLILKDKGQLKEAMSYYQRALDVNPTLADAHLNMGFALLSIGNYRQGWKEYEWRWKTEALIQHCRNFSKPIWDGSEIGTHTILLQCEQGLGDTIQFIRYAPLIGGKGAKVIVDCPGELISLIKNIDGVQQVIEQGGELPEFDLYCPLLSLPLIFNTTLESIPAKVPYIMVDFLLVQKWRDKVRHDNSKLKIGLVWAGRPEHKKDRNRSCSLDIFSPLAELSDISFYSLQKGEAAKQAKNPPRGMKLIDHTEEISDFSDTAALMENLDLIISVDTSVVHLAGALGNPVWTLLPFSPDWRWMIKREDTPWYPTMRLFRQPSPGGWDSLIVSVKDALLNFSNSN